MFELAPFGITVASGLGYYMVSSKLERPGRKVRELHETLGLTTVMVTHDMAEALLLADRVLVMEGGRAELTFADGCVLPLAAGSLLDVPAVSPCAGGVAGVQRIGSLRVDSSSTDQVWGFATIGHWQMSPYLLSLPHVRTAVCAAPSIAVAQPGPRLGR